MLTSFLVLMSDVATKAESHWHERDNEPIPTFRVLYFPQKIVLSLYSLLR